MNLQSPTTPEDAYMTAITPPENSTSAGQPRPLPSATFDPTPEDDPVVIGEPDYIKGPVVLVPGCNLPNRVAPSPTLQAAAEGAALAGAKQLLNEPDENNLDNAMAFGRVIDVLTPLLLRHFSFVEELVRENESHEKTMKGFYKDMERALGEHRRPSHIVADDIRELVSDLSTARAERDAAVKEKTEVEVIHAATLNALELASQEAAELRATITKLAHGIAEK